MDLLVAGGALIAFVLAYLIVRLGRAEQPSKRDLEWDALHTTSERMSEKYGEAVKAKEHRSLGTVTGGFEARGHFFPVYARSPLNRRWRVLRPISEVASEVGEMLRYARAQPPLSSEVGPGNVLYQYRRPGHVRL